MQTCMHPTGKSREKTPLPQAIGTTAHLYLVLIVLFIVITSASSPAHSGSQPPVHVPLDQIAPMRIESVHYERMVQEIVLSDAQRKRADQLFTAYRTKLDALHEEVRRQSREALTEVIEHVEAEGDFDPETFGWEQAARVLQAGHRLIRQARSRADEQLLHFEQEMKNILTDEQQERWVPAQRTIRRDCLLGRNLPQSARYDFSRHADIVKLYQEATERRGELAKLRKSGISPKSEAERLEAAQRIRDLLHHYEMQLDGLLESGRHVRNEALMQMELAAMRGRMERASVHHQRLTNSWRQVHQLTRYTAKAIGHAASPIVGEPARLRWMSRFWRESCPDLLAPDSAELMLEWALDLNELADTQREQIELLSNQYEQRRFALWMRAVRTRIEIHETQHLLLGNLETIFVEGHTSEALRKIEEQRAALAREASQELRTTLSPELIESFDQRLETLLGGGHRGRRVRY